MLLLLDEESFKEKMKFLVRACLLWGIGYILMWMLKWTITDIIYQKDTWQIAIYQTIFRINSVQYNGASISHLDTIAYNFKWLFCTNIKYLGIGGIWSMILPNLIVIYKRKIILTKKDIINAIPFLIVSISPIIWLLLMNNHSYYHSYFTYRNLLIFLLGIDLFFIKSINIKLTKKERHINENLQK